MFKIFILLYKMNPSIGFNFHKIARWKPAEFGEGIDVQGRGLIFIFRNWVMQVAWVL